MKLIVGLGNPGKEYDNTRHNTGFIAADELAKKFSVNFSFNKKIDGDVADIKIGRSKFFILKPATFMNNSGQAVSRAINYYEVDKTDIIVMHDDKDIPLGEYRLQTNRGPAGHKGIESIIESLKTKNFVRLRIGIQPIKKPANTAEFVLKRFAKKEIDLVHHAIDLGLRDIEMTYFINK